MYSPYDRLPACDWNESRVSTVQEVRTEDSEEDAEYHVTISAESV